MKVLCTSKDLSAQYFSAYHRAFFARYLNKSKPVWAAEIGTTSTVYAISIIRGCPFYLVNVPRGWGGRFGRIPSICFETIDPRLSRLWRYESRIVSTGDNDIFTSTLAIEEWIEERGFLERLVDGCEREVAIMTQAADAMDIEFD